MKRILCMAFLTFLQASLWQAIALSLPVSLNILCLPALVLAFSLQFFKPLETIWVSLLCGAIIDILGGFAIGVNMSLMLVLSYVLGATSMFCGRVSLRELSFYVLFLSLVYRVAFFITGLILVGQKTNISFMQLLLGPCIDALMSQIFFVILARMLIALKSFERNDFAKYGVGIER